MATSPRTPASFLLIFLNALLRWCFDLCSTLAATSATPVSRLSSATTAPEGFAGEVSCSVFFADLTLEFSGGGGRGVFRSSRHAEKV